MPILILTSKLIFSLPLFLTSNPILAFHLILSFPLFFTVISFTYLNIYFYICFLFWHFFEVDIEFASPSLLLLILTSNFFYFLYPKHSQTHTFSLPSFLPTLLAETWEPFYYGSYTFNTCIAREVAVDEPAVVVRFFVLRFCCCCFFYKAKGTQVFEHMQKCTCSKYFSNLSKAR